MRVEFSDNQELLNQSYHPRGVFDLSQCNLVEAKKVMVTEQFQVMPSGEQHCFHA